MKKKRRETEMRRKRKNGIILEAEMRNKRKSEERAEET